jgi:hypothetical protein
MAISNSSSIRVKPRRLRLLGRMVGLLYLGPEKSCFPFF